MRSREDQPIGSKWEFEPGKKPGQQQANARHVTSIAPGTPMIERTTRTLTTQSTLFDSPRTMVEVECDADNQYVIAFAGKKVRTRCGDREALFYMRLKETGTRLPEVAYHGLDTLHVHATGDSARAWVANGQLVVDGQTRELKQDHRIPVEIDSTNSSDTTLKIENPGDETPSVFTIEAPSAATAEVGEEPTSHPCFSLR